MRLIYCYILSTILFGYAESPPLAIFELDKSIIQKLDKGKVVTIKTDFHKEMNPGDGEHYQVYGIVNAPIVEVFSAVENFNDYPKFMPRFDYAEQINPSEYIFNIILPMNIKYQYRIEIQKSTPIWLFWETVPWEKNSIKETWGQWYLEPYDESGSKTLIRYQVYTDPGYIPYGFEWVIDIMTRISLPETVKNLKKWVENNEN